MKSERHPIRSGLMFLLRLTACAVIFALPRLLLAESGPAWWTTYGVVSGSANDYAAVNEGQVKNIAVAAVNELDNDLAQFGGAGSTLDNLSANLIASETNAQTNDYTAVNLGQLKNLVQPFYDRLIALGYTGAP